MTANVADALETLLLLEGRPLSEASLVKAASSMWGYEASDISLGLRRTIRRATRLGDSYPFQPLTHGGLRPRLFEGRHYLYLGLLLLSVRNWVRQDPSGSMLADAKLMEDITSCALGDFFGAHTRVLNFGWPSDAGRPEGFGEALGWLATRLGIDVGEVLPTERRRKDGGVDVVAWREMADRQRGVPLLLVQVTIMADLLGKERDIDRRSWGAWLNTDLDPLVGLATPAADLDPSTWQELSRNALVLDRGRLCSMSPQPPEALERRLSTFVANSLERARAGGMP